MRTSGASVPGCRRLAGSRTEANRNIRNDSPADFGTPAWLGDAVAQLNCPDSPSATSLSLELSLYPPPPNSGNFYFQLKSPQTSQLFRTPFTRPTHPLDATPPTTSHSVPALKGPLPLYVSLFAI